MIDFKALALMDECGRLRFMHLLLLSAAVKVWVLPGWASFCELAVVVGATAFRWTLEPKAIAPASDEDLLNAKMDVQKVADQVKQLSNRLSKWQLSLGFKPEV